MSEPEWMCVCFGVLMLIFSFFSLPALDVIAGIFFGGSCIVCDALDSRAG